MCQRESKKTGGCGEKRASLWMLCICMHTFLCVYAWMCDGAQVMCLCCLISAGCPSVKLIPRLPSFPRTFTFPFFSTIYVHRCSYFPPPSPCVIAVLIRCQVRVLTRGRLGKTGQNSLVRAPHCSVRHPAMSNRAQFVTKYWIFYYFHYNSLDMIVFLSAKAYCAAFSSKAGCSFCCSCIISTIIAIID